MRRCSMADVSVWKCTSENMGTRGNAGALMLQRYKTSSRLGHWVLAHADIYTYIPPPSGLRILACFCPRTMRGLKPASCILHPASWRAAETDLEPAVRYCGEHVQDRDDTTPGQARRYIDIYCKPNPTLSVISQALLKDPYSRGGRGIRDILSLEVLRATPSSTAI